MAPGWDGMGWEAGGTRPHPRPEPRGAHRHQRRLVLSPGQRGNLQKRKLLSQKAQWLRDKLTYNERGTWEGRERGCPVEGSGNSLGASVGGGQ